MYNYTDPKMQEVAKLCERGFWPICKNEYGDYAVFSPIFYPGLKLQRTIWSNDKLPTSFANAHSEGDYQPTQIVGFYPVPTPQFEIGDKVKLIGGNGIGIVKANYGEDVQVYFDEIPNIHSIYVLEPFIESEPVIVEMTIAQIEEKLGVKNLKIIK